MSHCIAAQFGRLRLGKHRFIGIGCAGTELPQDFDQVSLNFVETDTEIMKIVVGKKRGGFLDRMATDAASLAPIKNQTA